MFRSQATFLAIALASAMILVTPIMANTLSGASATADCTGYTLTVVTNNDLDANTSYEIDYSFTLTCGGSTTPIKGSIFFTTTNNGSSPDTSATETASGTRNGGTALTTNNGSSPDTSATETASGTRNGGTALTTNCSVTGRGTLTSSGSTVPITVNGSSSAPLSCATTGGPKSFRIGPSSMEGDLHISPGDWVSGGYNFKFIDNQHAATTYTVTATVTVPVSCPDGSTQNIVIPLGNPGQLDGGGVTTTTYAIAAGDTSNHATNNQNSILSWEGAVQAPATLCGGVTARNQTGAVFNATVTQNPHVGLVDWQFHYRDPAAKNDPNTDCTNASDPNRAKAAVCGASWSQTLRDP
jgi:hypothetical protein